MARDVKVQFVGSARDLAAAALEGRISIAEFRQEVERTAASSALAQMGARLGAFASGLALVQVPLPFIGPQMLPVAAGILAIAAAAVIVAAPLLAFAVGLTAAVTVMALVLGPLGLVGAGVLLLGSRTAEGAKAMAGLADHLNGMLDTLAKAAAPMMGPIIALLERMIPAVQSAGLQILAFFGQNLSSVLRVASDMTHALSDAFNVLWPIFANFLGQGLARMPAFEGLFRQILGALGGALQGGLTNLLRLSDWFMTALPTLGPIAAQVFGGIGSFIQGVGTVAAAVVGWIVAHWPQIAAVATRTWATIMAGWNGVAPMLQAWLPQALSMVTVLFGYLRDHGQLVHDVLLAVGIVAGLLVAAIVGIGVAIVGIVAGLDFLYNKFNDLMSSIDGAAGAAWRLVSGLGGVADKIRNMPGLGGALSIAGVPQFAEGGTVPGPLGAPRLILAHGGEEVTPPGARGGAGGQTTIHYHLTVNVPPTANQADIGRQIVGAIQEYERRSSASWRR